MIEVRVFRLRSALCMGSVTRNSPLSGVLEDVMDALGVVNTKTGALKSLQDFGRAQTWEVPAHAGSGSAISISSFTGSRKSFLSGGTGCPSFCRLSR